MKRRFLLPLIFIALPLRAGFAQGKTLLFGTIAVALALPLDSQVRDWMQGASPTADRVAEVGNAFGEGKYLAPGVAAVGLGSLALGKRKLAKVSLEAGEAFLISGAITNLLKTVTMRKRPSEASSPFEFQWGSRSFPSGHVTVATAVFTVFAREYGIKVLYIFPLLTAFARIRKNAHWLSDTVAGGLVGYAVASAVIRKKGFIALAPTGDGFIISFRIGG